MCMCASFESLALIYFFLLLFFSFLSIVFFFFFFSLKYLPVQITTNSSAMYYVINHNDNPILHTLVCTITMYYCTVFTSKESTIEMVQCGDGWVDE